MRFAWVKPSKDKAATAFLRRLKGLIQHSMMFAMWLCYPLRSIINDMYFLIIISSSQSSITKTLSRRCHRMGLKGYQEEQTSLDYLEKKSFRAQSGPVNLQWKILFDWTFTEFTELQYIDAIHYSGILAASLPAFYCDFIFRSFFF